MAVRSPFQTLAIQHACVSEDHAHAAISHSSARLSPALLKCQNDVPWTRREDVTAGCSPAASACACPHAVLLLTDSVCRKHCSVSDKKITRITISRINGLRWTVFGSAGHSCRRPIRFKLYPSALTQAGCQWPLTHWKRNRSLTVEILIKKDSNDSIFFKP